MKLTVHVPDDLNDQVREKLRPHIETGILEAVALDAILKFLQNVERTSKVQ